MPSPRYGVTVVGRLGLNDVAPVIECGRLPARAAVGEPFPVEATVFREGHDAVAASVVWRSPTGEEAPLNRMHPVGAGLDRWRTTVTASTVGTWSFVVEAWSDPVATWYHAVSVKVDAGQNADDLANDLETGARLFEQLATLAPSTAESALALAVVHDLRRTDADVPLRITRGMSREARSLAHHHPIRELLTRSPRYEFWSTGNVPCSAPGTSSSRGPSAPPWPPTRTTRPGRCGTAPWPTRPGTWTTSPTWTSTSSTCHRSTRSAS